MSRVEAGPRPATRARRPVVAVLAGAAIVAATVLLWGGPERTGVPGPPAHPPGLGDLWTGRAALVLERKWTSESLGTPDGGAYAGSHIEAVGGTWYLFSRRAEPQDCPGAGPGLRAVGTQVRASTDRGATWGRPVTILAPTPGTQWSCEATDGDATFDPSTGTWRYLFQCLGPELVWHGCYAERHDRSPLGPFTAPQPDPNPVIESGQLWSRICDDAGDRCGRSPGQRAIGEEGTFNIFDADDGGWWVSFHGYDGVHGYRGLARTTTFARDGWQVDGAAGTPTDAVIDARDGAGWRETWGPGGPVGAGAGSVLADDGWYYQLAEMADENLACTPGQNWDLGLFRTRTLSSTRWEQYPHGNPIVYSSRDGTLGCDVGYPNLFRDPQTGVTYLMHGRRSANPAYDGFYLYRLEWNRNLLANGGFWRANAEAWEAFPGTATQLAVERSPDGSPDGTPYLAFNCGVPTCDARASVYQDVPVDAGRGGDELAFGGTFRVDAGRGHAEMELLQLGARGEVVASTVVPIDATTEYAAARGRVDVDDRARTLRFQLYPRTPATFRADNLYAIPQDGCTAPRYPAC